MMNEVPLIIEICLVTWAVVALTQALLPPYSFAVISVAVGQSCRYVLDAVAGIAVFDASGGARIWSGLHEAGSQ